MSYAKIYLMLPAGSCILLTATTAIAGGTDAIRESADIIWMIVAAAMVFMMQPGFMCLESGAAPAKHSINVAIKNLGDFVIAVISFWALGFALMFGKSLNGIFGISGFFLSTDQPWDTAFFVFQAMFVGTAATIISGAIAGRVKFAAYLILSGIVSCIIYPVFGHWAWGGAFHDTGQGWLASLGFIDFAGSTVVHSLGGWVALAGVMVVGPRIGKFDRHGRPNKLSPHNMTLAYLGTFILFFGWFGFNGGSTLSAGPEVASIVLNTLLSACFGCLSATAAVWVFSAERRPQGDVIINGLLGGLVAVTAGCAHVDAASAALIGLVGGWLTYMALGFIEKKMKLDDVVGAVAVHGVAGAWGTVAVGLFIRPELLGGLSRLELTGIQLLGVLACFIWAFGTSFIFLKLVNTVFSLRVSKEDEEKGLNVSEHGATSTLLDMAQAMQQATDTGNFSGIRQVPVEPGTESGDLAQGFNRMLEVIHSGMVKLNRQKKMLDQEKRRAEAALADSEKERRKSDELLAALDQQRREADGDRHRHFKATEAYINTLADRTHVMASTMERNARRTRRMIDNITGIADLMNDTSARLKGVALRNREGVKRAEKAADHMNISLTHTEELGESAKEIGEISSVISDFASQTRMLSINALITSANAGEAGKKFGVVAHEIKELSDKSTRSTEMIVRQLETIESRIKKVVKQIGSSAEMLTQLNEESAENGSSVYRESQYLDELNEKFLTVSMDTEKVSTVLTQAMTEADLMKEQIQGTFRGLRGVFAEAPLPFDRGPAAYHAN